MARLEYLVIHCTATPEGREVSGADIRHWHCDPKPRGNGWKQVGYTDLFHLNGGVERLTPNNEDANVDPWEITNGVKGYNGVSRHIVYVGGLENRPGVPYKDLKSKDTRTDAQRKAMEKYVRNFHLKHPEVRIVGHRQLDRSKDCPSFSVPGWLRQIGIKQD